MARKREPIEVDAPADTKETQPQTLSVTVEVEPTKLARLPKDLEIERSTLLERVATLAVTDQASYEEMAKLQVTAATLVKRAEKFFEEELGLATLRQSYQTLLTRKGEIIKPLDEGQKTASRKNGMFLAEQERIRAEEQRKRDEEACRKAEEERQREIEQAKKEGATKKELAAMKAEPIVMAPPPAVEPTYEKQKGVSAPIADYEGEVHDFMALLKAIVKGDVPETAAEPNMVLIRQQARSLKELLNWPGVRVKVTYRTATRTGRV